MSVPSIYMVGGHIAGSGSGVFATSGGGGGSFTPIQFFVADNFTQGTFPVVGGGGPDGQLYARYGSVSGQEYGMVTANATAPTFNSQSSNFIRSGHTQSFQVSIQAGTSGFPADGETPAANGLWGCLLEPSTFNTTGYGVQGDWVHVGMWIYVQSATVLHTTTLEDGALKFCRSSYPSTTASKDDCHVCDTPNGFALLNEYDPNNAADNNYPDQRISGGVSTNQTGFPRDQWFFYEWGVLLESNGTNAIRRAWINNVLQLERNNVTIKWRTNDGVYHTMSSPNGVPSLPSSGAALQEFFIFTYWNAHPAVDTVIWMDGFITANEGRTTFNQTDNLGNPIIGTANAP